MIVLDDGTMTGSAISDHCDNWSNDDYTLSGGGGEFIPSEAEGNPSWGAYKINGLGQFAWTFFVLALKPLMGPPRKT